MNKDLNLYQFVICFLILIFYLYIYDVYIAILLNDTIVSLLNNYTLSYSLSVLNNSS